MPSHPDLAWLRVAVTLLVAALAALLMVLDGREPVAAAGLCLPAPGPERATSATAAGGARASRRCLKVVTVAADCPVRGLPA